MICPKQQCKVRIGGGHNFTIQFPILVTPQQKTQIDDQNGTEQIQQDINNKELTWRDREMYEIIN